MPVQALGDRLTRRSRVRIPPPATPPFRACVVAECGSSCCTSGGFMPHQRRFLESEKAPRARFGVVAPFSSPLAVGGSKAAESSLGVLGRSEQHCRKHTAAATALLSFRRATD